MKHALIVPVLLIFVATAGFAQGSETLPISLFEPSSLALALARFELEHNAASFDVDDRLNGESLYQAALEIEPSLRFGTSAQEARVQFRRSLRLARSFGAAKGKQVNARLKKYEGDPGKMAAKTKSKGVASQRAPVASQQNPSLGKGYME
ncbi:hypothetical protein MASR2M78_22180 [Treponema sp.]